MVFCKIVIIHYGRYSKLIEDPNVIAIFENCKKGNVNVNRKNGGVDTNRKNVKDDERNDENFAMNTESVINLNANIMNPREADKSDGDITSTLLSKVRKKVDNIDKNIDKIRKRVGNANKDNGEIRKRVGDADKSAESIISNFFGEVGKGVSDQHIGDCISVFFGKFKKRVCDNTLTNILVNLFRNLVGDLDFPSIFTVDDLVTKFYINSAIFTIIDTFAKLYINFVILAIINTLAKPFANLNAIFKN